MSRSNCNSSSSSGTAMNPKPKPKKFCTRGEEFFDFIKALGYHPSKHQQHEHFEYLFQDEKSSSFVRKLMLTLKTENCLLPEDIHRYEDLKKQDMILYGDELEEAVSRRRIINEMYSQQKLKRLAKKNELERTLEEQTKEVERLSKLRDEVFLKEVEEWEIKKAKISCVLRIIERLITEYEKEIDIDLKLLTEKMEELEKTVVQLKKDLKPDQAKGEDDKHYLCQIDITRLLEKEGKLFEKVQEMISKHGTELIMKDAGYAVEGDPLNEENIRKIFSQFEKDFDRLKHCIIYEKVNEVSLQLSLAGDQGSLDNFDECHSKAVQLALLDSDKRKKIQVTTRNTIKDLTTAYDRESRELLDRVRQFAAAAVNQQFSAIMNIKARAKKKLQDFFTLTTNVLKAQKVRISLIRSLVKSEGKIYGRLVSNIEENIAASTAQSKKLASKPCIINGLNEEGHVLKFLLALFGVTNPYEVITSLPQVHLIVNKCLNELEDSYWMTIEEGKYQSMNLKKHLGKTHEVLKSVLQSTNELHKEGVRAKSLEKEDYLKKQKHMLQNLQQTRAGLSKETQKRRAEGNQKLRNILNSV